MNTFGHPEWPDVAIMPALDNSELNSVESQTWVEMHDPDIVMIFGCGMIREPLMSALPRDKINLHLGLSPRYRGAATLFWPFYFLEPQMAGCTFHYIKDEPDAGTIVHQCVPDLEMSDGIHDVAVKAVLKAADDAVKLLRAPVWEYHQQVNTGKCFLASDFKPQHLRLIYDQFDNKIVREYLTHNLPDKPQPKLIQSV
jgi:methionyl-tRNA formyltransferase